MRRFSPTSLLICREPAFPSPPTITALTPNYRTPYTINSSIQVSRQLTQNDALTVGYVNTGARDLTYERDMNLINPVSYLADGRPIYSSAVNASTRLYPQFNGIKLEDTGATANYNALIVNFMHRFSAGFQTNASYTWSHALSDAPDLYGYDTSNALIEDPDQPPGRLWQHDREPPQRVHHEFGVHTYLQPVEYLLENALRTETN